MENNSVGKNGKCEMSHVAVGEISETKNMGEKFVREKTLSHYYKIVLCMFWNV